MSAGASGDCYSNSNWTGHCSVSNSGSHVDLSGSQTRSGSDSDTHTSPGSSGAAEREPQPAPAVECGTALCRPTYEVIAIPEVTIADLASFRPAAPSLTGEPEGFGVVGMPANLVAAASVQHLSGSLLGWDVVVRFTPSAYVFHYGDGTSTRTRTGGATWPALGQAQFTPTATSHVYRERGTYDVGVTVEYAAAVDFGTGWLAVPGMVSASTGGYGIRVVEVHTALVDRTCLENPEGPGC